MKQVTQRLRDGSIAVLDVPAPGVTPDTILVDVRASLLSAGTERARTEAAEKGLIGKARARPDQARQVWEKARRDGLRDTLETVRLRLDQPSAIGYSSAGVVLAVGSRVRGFAVGNRVACGGSDAVHADLNVVPTNLAVSLPDGVSFDHGAFATVGSIAMHGIRQADVRLGERVGVIGLGLVGQLAAQILHAAGCSVVGVDINEELVELAQKIGAVDFACVRSAIGEHLPAAIGACDAVMITAATRSNDPVDLAARLCRDRGRVVVVGDVHIDVPRAPYYEKELELRLSRSYGPGRYDREYEQRGLDYPIGYVRWTERRNMQAFVEFARAGKLDLEPLITQRVPVAHAATAYEELKNAARSPLGIIINYTESESSASADRAFPTPRRETHPDPLAAGVVGAGSFAQRILIPSLRGAGFSIESVASASGLSARAAADRFGINRATTVDEVLDDPETGLVAIATRHSTHAELALRALALGKDVFVEKPPCLTVEELLALREAQLASGRRVAVGFNRRHAPLAMAMRDHIVAEGAPIELLYRINAGPSPPGHWLDDPAEGGGRLLGEGCHFVDFACWFVGATAESVTCFLAPSSAPLLASQAFSVSLQFGNGSIASVVYGTGGAGGVGKEYVEAHAGGRSATVDDYRSLTTWRGGRRRIVRDKARDKGHAAQFNHLAAVQLGRTTLTDPPPLDTMAVTLAALQSALTGRASNPRKLAAPGLAEAGTRC